MALGGNEHFMSKFELHCLVKMLTWSMFVSMSLIECLVVVSIHFFDKPPPSPLRTRSFASSTSPSSERTRAQSSIVYLKPRSKASVSYLRGSEDSSEVVDTVDNDN